MSYQSDLLSAKGVQQETQEGDNLQNGRSGGDREDARRSWVKTAFKVPWAVQCGENPAK